MLSRYGAYAASERAFAAVEARAAALEPWGRSVSTTTSAGRQRGGGGRGVARYLRNPRRSAAR